MTPCLRMQVGYGDMYVAKRRHPRRSVQGRFNLSVARALTVPLLCRPFCCLRRRLRRYPATALGRMVVMMLIVVMLVQVPVQINKLSEFFEGGASFTAGRCCCCVADGWVVGGRVSGGGWVSSGGEVPAPTLWGCG